MRLEGSVPCSQQPATCPYSGPDESSPHPHNQYPSFLKIGSDSKHCRKQIAASLTPCFRSASLSKFSTAVSRYHAVDMVSEWLRHGFHYPSGCNTRVRLGYFITISGPAQSSDVSMGCPESQTPIVTDSSRQLC
jgi:hypothetical protein